MLTSFFFLSLLFSSSSLFLQTHHSFIPLTLLLSPLLSSPLPTSSPDTTNQQPPTHIHIHITNMLFKSAAALLTFAGLVAAQGTPSAELKHGSANVTNLNGTFFFLLAFLSSLYLSSITAKGERTCLYLFRYMPVCLSVCLLFIVSFISLSVQQQQQHSIYCLLSPFLLRITTCLSPSNSFLYVCNSTFFYLFLSWGRFPPFHCLPCHDWLGDTFAVFLQHNQLSGVYSNKHKNNQQQSGTYK